MTGMDIFNIVAGIASILGLAVTLMVKGDVSKIKTKINTGTQFSGGQRVTGSGNTTAGGNIE